ncbi:Carboxypeptidase C (cathepsin A) [Streptoalloteichus tenebrarius]|uniref:Carboxypeptidase C (Cathepsin A) n=1 Tax=Streptoalloteichus tenebrarius (strain ATCC 17920 / DSM 40477 / JCM 4838 / CBS 697.72 / NBRC 16177 / NCIMB 11028 / NRRL B-12390 / A12253. 1 / ISP 5477) TaxID=1933 RepID=A0ABT1HU11_STRSD|nr:peptidase S10 [Streptoalloteichus tenebrarius]MCP2258981.1 Carboxypeptidase C (cathepsin A) [Streptoalloteichus tenebrarius]BFF01190.1 peptidase S10 [Streptoalloteichus tenebrarius]
MSKDATERRSSGQPDDAEDTRVDASPEPTDDLVTTRHTLTADGRELTYTATAGRVVLRREVHNDGRFDGHLPKAEVFVTAYTLDGADPGTRPVTFAFNGGPGSSSVWLHLGLFGPRRVVMGDAGNLLPPPYGLTDNAETLLAHSDLVFVDPVSTGYSRAVKGEKPEDYHGFQGDLESVGEIIRLWTTRHGRWMSPKFLAGESYGTLRAAALADHLQTRYGMYLNGLVLISAVLDMGTIRFTQGNDLPYALFLPTYAAIAHHHGLHGDRPLPDLLAEATEFAAKDYPWALSRGARLSDAERAETVRRVASLTGLDADYVDRVDLRLEHVRFFTELLRDRRQVVGRLDGRFTGWDPDAGREHFVEDPSLLAIMGPYTAALNHYVHAELDYHNDLPYEILTDRVHPWSYREFEGAHVNVADKLANAMRSNPHLLVHVACGYHDGATPFAAAEHTMANLAIPPVLRDNIEFRYYEAGHMMYVHEPTRVQQSADIAAFLRSAAPTS